MSASIWDPGTGTPVADAENSSITQSFTASDGQTVFNLTLFTYIIGVSSLVVYRNGVKLPKSSVSEDTSASFSLIGITLAAGELIEAVGVIGSATNAATAAEAAAASALASQTSATNSASTASTAASTASTAATNASNSATTASTASTTATNAATSATASATSAATSAGLASGYLAPVTDISATSTTVGTGSKTFTCSAGKAFVPGHPVKIARTSDAANTYMTGVVTAYNSGTGSLTVSVSASLGTGTFTDWTISIQASTSVIASAVSFTPTGTIAASNVQAAIAEVASEALQVSNNLSDITNAATARANLGAAASGANTDITSLASPAIGAATATTQAGSDNSTKVATTAQVQAAIAAAASGIPAGVVSPFAGSTAPTGWLLCAGQAVSRTTYAALFAVIATTYGAGDGSTTFNLPDLRGRAVRGVDNMGGSAANRITSGGSGIAGTTLGAAGGAETVALSVAQMPAHSHTISAHDSIPTGAGSVVPATTAGSVIANPSTSSQGSGSAHQNTAPTMMLNYIIKT